MERAIKTGILFMIVLFSTAYSYGQDGEIKGTIVDEYGPLPGANVKLKGPQSADEIRREITDFEGSFTIFTELDMPLYLEISYLGYQTIYTDTFNLSLAQKKVDLKSIKMEMKSEMLNSVKITGNKRPVSFSNGKMKIEVEDTPMAKGESASSLFRQLPGVSTGKDGEIQLRGKSGVQIRVNGRKLNLKGEELENYLQSLPSDAIGHIELDTKSSAAQDAEGGAGVLSIQLKENRSESLTGSVSAGYTYQDRHLWNSNVFLSQQKKNWDWSIIVDASKKGNIRNETMQTDFNESSSLENLKQEGKEIYKSHPLFTQLTMNYDINQTHSLGISLELGKKRSLRDWNSISDTQEKDNTIPHGIQSFNRHREKFDHGVIHAYYQFKTDTLGSGIKVSLDGSEVKRNMDSHFENEFDSGTSDSHSDLFKAPADNDYKIFAAKVDYKKHWKNGMTLGFGTKYSQVEFKSHLDFFEIKNSIPEFDEERSNTFDYDENIWANYAEFTADLHPKLKMNLGLRMEKTWGKGIEQIIDSKYKKDYMDWFPSLSLQQTVNHNYQIEYAYTKQITRPQYDFLNPQIFYIDPYNFAEGNPSLQPQRMHSFSMNHLIQQKYQIGLSFDYTKDFMVEVPMIDTETNQTSFSTRNINHVMDMGVNTYIPITIAPYWNMNNSLVANYQSYKLDLEENTERKNEHLFVLFQNQQQIQLPKGIQLNLNISARSPFNYGYYKICDQWWTDISLKKGLLENNLDVSLKFTDVFKTTNTDVDYGFNGNSSSIKQYMGNRSVSVNLTYKFGGEIGKKLKNKNEFEEYKRIEQ